MKLENERGNEKGRERQREREIEKERRGERQKADESEMRLSTKVRKVQSCHVSFFSEKNPPEIYLDSFLGNQFCQMDFGLEDIQLGCLKPFGRLSGQWSLVQIVWVQISIQIAIFLLAKGCEV